MSNTWCACSWVKGDNSHKVIVWAESTITLTNHCLQVNDRTLLSFQIWPEISRGHLWSWITYLLGNITLVTVIEFKTYYLDQAKVLYQSASVLPVSKMQSNVPLFSVEERGVINCSYFVVTSHSSGLEIIYFYSLITWAINLNFYLSFDKIYYPFRTSGYEND